MLRNVSADQTWWDRTQDRPVAEAISPTAAEAPVQDLLDRLATRHPHHTAIVELCRLVRVCVDTRATHLHLTNFAAEDVELIPEEILKRLQAVEWIDLPRQCEAELVQRWACLPPRLGVMTAQDIRISPGSSLNLHAASRLSTFVTTGDLKIEAAARVTIHRKKPVQADPPLVIRAAGVRCDTVEAFMSQVNALRRSTGEQRAAKLVPCMDLLCTDAFHVETNALVAARWRGADAITKLAGAILSDEQALAAMPDANADPKDRHWPDRLSRCLVAVARHGSLPASDPSILKAAQWLAQRIERATPQVVPDAASVSSQLRALGVMAAGGVLTRTNSRVYAAAMALLAAIDHPHFIETADLGALADSFAGLQDILIAGVMLKNGHMLRALARMAELTSAAQTDFATPVEAVAGAMEGLVWALQTKAIRADDLAIHSAAAKMALQCTPDSAAIPAPLKVTGRCLQALGELVRHLTLPDAKSVARDAAIALVQQVYTAIQVPPSRPADCAKALQGIRTLIELHCLPDDLPFLAQTVKHLAATLPGLAGQSGPVEILGSLDNLGRLSDVPTLDGAPLLQACERLATSMTAQRLHGSPLHLLARGLKALADIADKKAFAHGAQALQAAAAGLVVQGLDQDFRRVDPASVAPFAHALQQAARQGLLDHGFLQAAFASFSARHRKGVLRTDKISSLLLMAVSNGWVAAPAQIGSILPQRQAMPAPQDAALMIEHGVDYLRRERIMSRNPAAWLADRAVFNEIMQLAPKLPWHAMAEHGPSLRSVCEHLDRLQQSVEACGDTTASRLLNELLCSVAAPALADWVRTRQSATTFDASLREVGLVARYLGQTLLPVHEPIASGEFQRIAESALDRLASPPTALPASALNMPILFTDGTPVCAIEAGQGDSGQPLLSRRATSVWKTLLGPTFPPPLVVQLRPEQLERPGDIPAYVRHEEQWYRIDLLRGGLNKGDKDSPPQFLGVPVAVSGLLNHGLFTSIESRFYAQRALLPEHAERITTSQQNDRPLQPQLAGRFELAIVTDSEAHTQFVPRGDHAHLRAKDGCGFIRERLARQLLGNERYEALMQPPRRQAVQSPARKGVPLSALQFYDASPDQCEQVAQAFLASAVQTLRHPLEQLADVPPLHELQAAVNGRMHNLALTAYPVQDLGSYRVVLPDTDQFRALARDGLIMGRNPYDTRSLCRILPHEIAFSTVPAIELQVSLTGFTKGKDGPEAQFYKGLLAPLPESSWPEGQRQDIVFTSKDVKLHTRFTSLTEKERIQKSGSGPVSLYGALVVKDIRTASVGVTPELQEGGFKGDFDGDYNQIFAPIPGLWSLIGEPGLNPKLPKTFTPDHGQSDAEKVIQLMSGLVQDASSIEAHYYALLPEMAPAVLHMLHATHVLDKLFPAGEPWVRLAGLPENLHAMQPRLQAELIVRREIEILHKAGTDQEKTGLNFALIDLRREEYKNILAPNHRKPWSLRGLEAASRAFASREMPPSEQKAMVREVLERQLDSTLAYNGQMPNRIARMILGWFLGRAPERPNHTLHR